MDNSQKEYLGKKVKEHRERLGLSQIELAKRVHKSSAAYIAYIEAGNRNISTMDLMLLAKEFGTPVSELIGENDSQPRTFQEALRSASDVTKSDREKIEAFYGWLQNQKNKNGN